MEERNSATEDSLVDIKSMTKEILKYEKSLTQNILKIWDTVTRPKLRIIGIEEGEETLLKGTENTFSVRIEVYYCNIHKDVALNVQESYKTPNRLNKKEIPWTHNNQNTKYTESLKILRTEKEK